MKKSKEIKLCLKKEKVSELNKQKVDKLKGGTMYNTYEMQCGTYPTCLCWTGPKQCPR